MFIKFKYVVDIGIAVTALVVLVVLVAGVFVVGSKVDGDTPMSPVVSSPTADDSPSGGDTPRPRSEGSGDYGAAIQAANRTASPNSKKKDALGGSGWKINLYEETGDTHYDRAKVDRDRDETWDEKWTWKGGQWERDGGAEIWDGKDWVAANADTNAGGADAVGSRTPKVDKEPAVAGRDTGLAQYAKRVLNERASGKKAKDFTGGSGPKINLYDDDEDGKWDRGKVDVDRDDTWDQKWTVKSGTLERKIEATGEVHVFDGTGWVAKK